MPMDLLNKKVGILGGGQLSRMLAQAAQKMGLQCHIFCNSADEPAAQVTAFCHILPKDLTHKKADTKQFMDWIHAQVPDLSILTFESEFFNFSQTDIKTPFYIFPKIKTMHQLQFRTTQKTLLLENKIPTAPFFIIHNTAELNQTITEFKINQNPLVLKTAFGGYDGYGTFFLKNQDSCEQVLNKASNYLNESDQHCLIAEPMISFHQEQALIAIRNKNSETVFFPLVTTKQLHGRCDWVHGPSSHPKLEALEKKIRLFLEKIDYVGAIGIELFDCTINNKRELWVNELAPRVHNSGHYSQDALNIDQFTAHWLAGLGMTMPTIMANSKQFAMMNLIGESNSAIQSPENIHTSISTGHLHLYAKKENRPGRKMGHLNLTVGEKKISSKKNQTIPLLIQEGIKIRRRFRL